MMDFGIGELIRRVQKARDKLDSLRVGDKWFVYLTPGDKELRIIKITSIHGYVIGFRVWYSEKACSTERFVHVTDLRLVDKVREQNDE